MVKATSQTTGKVIQLILHGKDWTAATTSAGKPVSILLGIAEKMSFSTFKY